MIVVCTACSAKFRVADEKVGPRGIRIRCTKCQNVFTVRRDAEAGEAPPAPPPPVPRFELDLDDAAGAGARSPHSPPQADPFARLDDPFAAAAFADPFAPGTARADPVAAPASDPFGDTAGAATAASSSADPFAGAGFAMPAGAPSLHTDDPFAALGASPGAGAEAAPPPSLVTDLSDLDPGLSATFPPAAPPPLPRRAAAAAEAPPSGPGIGLALEERSPAGSFPGPDAFGWESGAELSPDTGGFPDLVAPPAPPAGDEPVAAALAPVEPPPAAVSRPAPAPAREKRTVAPPVRGTSRLHAVVVNSLSLAILLALTAGFFTFWRSEGRRGPLDRGRGGAVVATQVSSGLYSAASGRLLLFVRGEIRVQAPSSMGPVTVQAEMLKGEEVVAKARVPAGAVPSAEEVASVDAAADVERLRALLTPRAPKKVRPGEALPFLVIFPEYPADLADVTFRVVAEAAPASGPG